MKPPFLRTAYNYDMNKAGDESGLECKDPTLAQQSFKDECDINVLVARFGLAGEIPPDLRTPQYGDFNEVVDFTTAMQAVVDARENFMQLPGQVRARFHNDPQEFLQFCSDENNTGEMMKLGLLSTEAVSRFELEAQTQKDLDELNRRDAEAFRAAKAADGGPAKKGTT